MSQKTRNAYERDKIMSAFVGELCPGNNMSNINSLSALQQEYEAYRDSLDEINAMILYSQDRNDEDEVAYWRKFLMRTKMSMREIKEKIKNYTVANNMTKEMAYS